MFYKRMKQPEDSGVKMGAKFNTKRKSMNSTIFGVIDPRANGSRD